MNRLSQAILLTIAVLFLAPVTGYSQRGKTQRDSLNTDGPYILYSASGARMISVDQEGDISDERMSSLPEGYTFTVKDHRGKLPFEVTLRPIQREPWHYPSKSPKTFVMSDPHGRLDCVVSLLQGNGVIGEDLKWSYGDGHLVVIGDIFDRGEDVTQIFWLFYELQREAPLSGGKVTMLLGNHEPMEFAGDMRYAKPKYTALANALSVEYRNLWNKDSELGRWIGSWNTVALIGDNIYVHGGLGKDFYDWNLPVEEVNRQMSRAIYLKSAERKALSDTLEFLYGSFGPIWYRGLVQKDSKRRPIAADSLQMILSRYRASHIIVGHTIFKDISTFYGGKVIDVNVDNRVNMRKRRGRALLIENGEYWVVGDKGKKRRLSQPLP
ncbi:MAG: metallophosphoesterase [Bacteroidales bacterium]|nr:metallophosphoesterase [Bacteroidales bacterium]